MNEIPHLEGDGQLTNTNTSSPELPEAELLIVPYERCEKFDPYGLVKMLEEKGTKILYLKNASTYWYTGDENIKTSLVQKVLSQLSEPYILTTNAPADVSIIPMRTPGGTLVIHFLNYTWSEKLHRFIPPEKFYVKLCLPGLPHEISSLILYTPEGSDRVLASPLSSSCLHLEIPPFKTWSFLILK